MNKLILFSFVFSHETQDTSSVSSSRQGGHRDYSFLFSTSSSLASGIRGALSEAYLPYLLGFPLSTIFQRESQARDILYNVNIHRKFLDYVCIIAVLLNN